MTTTWRDLVERPTWFEDANCKGLDPNLFFPHRGENNICNAAKAVCHACDVAVECLAYAMNTGEMHGVWGGLSEHQRRRVRAVHNTTDVTVDLRGPLRAARSTAT